MMEWVPHIPYLSFMRVMHAATTPPSAGYKGLFSGREAGRHICSGYND